MTNLSVPAAQPATDSGSEPDEVSLHLSSYSQMDPKWGFAPGTERSMCGVICLKAVLDHHGYRYGENMPSPVELYETIKSQYGWDARLGITHAAEVAILMQHGLLAWRRDWENPQTEPQSLENAGGYTPAQVAAAKVQHLAEANLPDLHDKIKRAIVGSLFNQSPVIASVRRGFSGNAYQHQILVTGWSDAEVEVMDPEASPGHTNYSVKIDYFFTYFNLRAIFAKSSAAAN